MKILSPQRFPMHDGQTITVLTHKNIPSKIENKRQSVKIENPRSSWTMALSRSIITQAIHHQPPIKAKYNNYFVLRGRAPPRYVSSVHVRTVSNFDGKFLLHRRRYTNAALKNAGKKLMWDIDIQSSDQEQCQRQWRSGLLRSERGPVVLTIMWSSVKFSLSYPCWPTVTIR